MLTQEEAAKRLQEWQAFLPLQLPIIHQEMELNLKALREAGSPLMRPKTT